MLQKVDLVIVICMYQASVTAPQAATPTALAPLASPVCREATHDKDAAALAAPAAQ